MKSLQQTSRRLFINLSLCAVTVATLGALGSAPSYAAVDRGTKEEAKAMSDAALAHIKKVGAEQAYKDFTTNKASWTKKDLYVFVMDLTGKMVAHGANEKLVGRDLINLKDSSGKAFVVDMIAAAKKGSGWVDYEWADPTTKKVEGKSSYVQMVPTGSSFVGVGIYR